MQDLSLEEQETVLGFSLLEDPEFSDDIKGLLYSTKGREMCRNTSHFRAMQVGNSSITVLTNKQNLVANVTQDNSLGVTLAGLRKIAISQNIFSLVKDYCRAKNIEFLILIRQ